MEYQKLIEKFKQRYEEEGFSEALRQEYIETIEEDIQNRKPMLQTISTEKCLVTVIDYDHEDAWCCEPFSALVSLTDAQDAENLISDAIKEYYTYTDFHDEITGFGTRDLVRIFLSEANFPIEQYFIDDKNMRTASRDFYREFR